MTKLNVTDLGKLTKEAFEAKGFEMDSKQSKVYVETVFEVIREQLIIGNDIDVFGFGKLENKIRKARKGRNPASGIEIEIPEKRAVGFKPAKKLKDGLNN